MKVVVLELPGHFSEALLSFPLLSAICKEGREKGGYKSGFSTQAIMTSGKSGKHWIDYNTFLISIL